ncbi:MAG: hypothetical protein N2315_03365 [Thermanaerothrix sp.]|nr:hypothetical protein [Thermanaerothrix sp.]
MRLIRAEEVRRLLPMGEAAKAVRRALAAWSADRAQVPVRERLSLELGDVLFMPASVKDVTEAAGIKVVSVFPGNASLDKPSVSAMMVLLSPQTGEVEALMDGTELTRIRTGAVTCCATDLLARKDAAVGALFGTGGQGMTQLEGMLTARPLERVNVYDQDRERAQRFVNAASKLAESRGCRLLVADSPEDAVADAMVITTATTSSKPVFPGAMLSMGAHVNAIGAYTPTSRELDSKTMERADLVYVDYLKGALEEAGDILIPIGEGLFGPERIAGELGELVLGTAEGRTGNFQITVMKSVGFGALDVVCANRVLQRALEEGLGEEISL